MRKDSWLRGALLSVLVLGGLVLLALPAIAQGGGPTDGDNDDDSCPYSACVTAPYWDAEFLQQQMDNLGRLIAEHNNRNRSHIPDCLMDCTWGPHDSTKRSTPWTKEDYAEAVAEACALAGYISWATVTGGEVLIVGISIEAWRRGALDFLRKVAARAGFRTISTGVGIGALATIVDNVCGAAGV